MIVAHLGNGASLCAIRDGRSVASTMGFTTVDGLVMGTRCGALDPGVLIHLMDQYGMGPRELENLIYRESGLLGVSGISSDMRVLRAAAEPEAKEAIALFVYRIQREIGSLEVGKKADVVIVRPHQPSPLLPQLFYDTLINDVDGADVETVLVDGKVVVADHQLVNVNEAEIQQKTIEATQALWKRSGAI